MKQLLLLLALSVLFISPTRAQNVLETPPFYNGKILPTPKQVKYGNSSIQIDRTGATQRTTAVCVAPELRNDVAVRELLGKFAAVGASVDVISDPKDQGRYATVFLLGEQPAAEGELNRCGLTVPSQREGYLIHVSSSAGRSVVICLGNDRQGDYWSVQSLKQLIFRDGDAVRMRVAEVIDYPTLRFRGIIGVRPEVPWLLTYKFNCGVLAGPQDWRKPSDEEKRHLQEEITWFKTRYFAPLMAVNPTNKPGLVISDAADVARLTDCFRISLDSGGGISLLLDDTSFPLCEADKQRFGDGGTADRYLIDRIYQLRKDYPDFSFFVCPPFYASDLLGYYSRYGEDGNKYYGAVRDIPKDINLFWTGPSVTSQGCTATQASSWSSIIGRKPIYWDNWYQYGYPLVPKNFPVAYTGLYREIDGYMMAYGARDGDCVGLATLADYCWNPESYQPQESVRSAVEQLAGSDVSSAYVQWLEKKDALDKLYRTLQPPRILHDIRAVPVGNELFLSKGIHQNMFMFYRTVNGITKPEWKPDVWPIKCDPKPPYEGRTVFELADIDGDGVPELLIADPGGAIDIYRCSPSSDHTAWERNGTLAGDIPRKPVLGLCAGDFDGDGKTELFACFTNDNGAAGYRNTGGGTNGHWLEDKTLTAGLNISGVTRPYLCAGDVNGDGRPDLIVGTGEGNVRIFLNAGREQALMWQESVNLTNGIYPVSALASPAFFNIGGRGRLYVGDCFGVISGYSMSSGEPAVWTRDDSLVPFEARNPVPPVESLLKDLEGLSGYISSRSRNQLIGRQIEQVSLQERNWADENIFIRIRSEK